MACRRVLQGGSDAPGAGLRIGLRGDIPQRGRRLHRRVAEEGNPQNRLIQRRDRIRSGNIKRHVAGFTGRQRQHGLTVADNLPRRGVHGRDDARLRRDQARPAEAFAGISPRGLAAFCARATSQSARALSSCVRAIAPVGMSFCIRLTLSAATCAEALAPS
jgi:hypothetical protein